MSIIDDALQRVQDRRFQPAKKAPVSAPEKPPNPERRPAAHPWQTALPKRPDSPPQSQTAPLIAVALAVLLLTAALIIGGAFWMGRTLTTPPHADRASDQLSSTSPPAPGLAELQPAEAAPAHPGPSRNTRGDTIKSGLVLTGVVEGLGEPYAMINGAIVAVGERVGNATLEQISKSSVTLRYDDGREIVLRVPR